MDYMIIDVAPQERIAPKSLDELYPIANLPDYLQPVFGSLKHLNQLQTKVRECCFETDESVLICAPTGAGKTNVALLCILREVHKAYNPDTHTLADFKIVYISPLKALATEIVEKFDEKLKPLKVNVKEYTGDMGLTRQELQETHIIVATPEKWDVMTRKSSAIADLVTLIIFDEIHLLDEERGRVLECIIARTLMLAERNQKLIRLAGLSATLPNYIDVAKFMKVKKGLYYFSEAYRPVPLYKKFIGVRKPKKY
jgi:replicative superfamily II helicase